MNKAPVLITLVITILLLSIQLVFLFKVNSKIDDTKLHVNNLEAVIERSLGKYIEIQPPASFVSKLNEFSKKLDGEITIEELIIVEDEFNTLIKNTKKWVVDEQFSELNSLSTKMKLRHLLLQAESNMNEKNIDSLIDAFDDSRIDLDKDKLNFYQDRIESLVTSYKIKKDKEFKNELVNYESIFNTLIKSNDTRMPEYNELLYALDKYDHEPLAIDLISKVEDKIKIIKLSEEISSIQNMLIRLPENDIESTLELLSQCSSESMKMYQEVISTKNIDLIKKHEDLVESIENELKLANQKINRKMNQRINNYNLWALDSINTFQKKMHETKSEMGILGDIKKEKGLKVIFNDMREYLLVIDQNLLLESVREIYSKIYADARSILDNEYYTLEIAKASAKAKRKILSDTDYYAKKQKLAAK